MIILSLLIDIPVLKILNATAKIKIDTTKTTPNNSSQENVKN